MGSKKLVWHKKPELTLAKTAKVLSVSCFIIAVNQHLLRKCALKSECPLSDGWEPWLSRVPKLPEIWVSTYPKFVFWVFCRSPNYLMCPIHVVQPRTKNLILFRMCGPSLLSLLQDGPCFINNMNAYVLEFWYPIWQKMATNCTGSNAPFFPPLLST